MSTNLDNTLIAPAWQCLASDLQQWHGEQEVVDQLLANSYDELELWRSELAQEQARLDIDQTTLRQEREELAQQKAEWEQQRSHLQANSSQWELESGANQAAVAEMQHKLALAEQELEALRDQSATHIARAEQHKLERSQHEEQYAALELELEHVRNKASEMTDTLSHARCEWERERSLWEEERRELQSLLAHQQSQLKDYLTRHETTAVPPANGNEAAAVAQQSNSDSVVVGSVLAQFERIRNERAIRRRKANEAS